jgi:hypothetical protein
VENAPTAFGPVAIRARSKVNDGFVEVHVTPPDRPLKSMLLRAPLPEGWRVQSASIDGRPTTVAGGDQIDLSGKTKPMVVKFAVQRTAGGD